MSILEDCEQEVESKIIEKVYEHFRAGLYNKYNEERHCKKLIKVMLDKDKGRVSSFCVEEMISEDTFQNWVKKHELFRNLYYFSKMVAREIWEEQGNRIRDTEYAMGTINYAFEHWKMVGWSRFGVSKNSRLKLNLNADDSPAEHYATILRQAADGDFTASEFKQLMEAVNVGLNVVQTIDMQKQIDELKSDLATMQNNKDVQNPFTTKGIAQTN